MHYYFPLSFLLIVVGLSMYASLQFRFFLPFLFLFCRPITQLKYALLPCLSGSSKSPRLKQKKASPTISTQVSPSFKGLKGRKRLWQLFIQCNSRWRNYTVLTNDLDLTTCKWCTHLSPYMTCTIVTVIYDIGQGSLLNWTLPIIPLSLHWWCTFIIVLAVHDALFSTDIILNH